MILITKEEAMALREKYCNTISITITGRQKNGNRKKYYVEESNRVLNFLDRRRRK